MLDKKQILEMFKEFEQMTHWRNRFEKYLDARVELDNFFEKNADEGDWVSAVNKTYTRALFNNFPDSIKQILLSESDSDKKKVDELMDSLEGFADQNYLKKIVKEELKKMKM